ncbi:hypothetical protein [Enterobacter hormaechei]|uniref:hypothetical protein n=1 Tax=Enterobacter hormaechei TaxID=158836 RepID=UPI00331578C4
MTVIVECIETNGDWTVGHRYAGKMVSGGFLALKDDDTEDDFEWTADSRQVYDRETDEFETIWFLPGIEGVSFREIE